MATKQTGKVTIGGVLLAILAAIFFPRGNDGAATPDGGSTPAVSQPAVPKADAPKPPAPAPTADPTPKPTPAPKVETPAPKAATPPPAAPPKPAVTAPATNPPKPAPTPPAQAAPKATTPPATGPPPSTSRVGFTSRRSLEDHFDKHGAEFGRITIDEYLAAAKALRDAPLSKDVLEIVRADGVITRFDKRTGNFTAFHDDKTIRTLFRPNDGEAYFRRQGQR
jgi:outer membrane biosynthesis protein TonB